MICGAAPRDVEVRREAAAAAAEPVPRLLPARACAAAPADERAPSTQRPASRSAARLPRPARPCGRPAISTRVEVGLEGSVSIDLVERSHRDEPDVRVRTHLRVQVAAEEKWQISAPSVDVAADHGLLHCRTQPRQLGLRRLLVGLDRDDVVLDLGQIGVRLRELLGRPRSRAFARSRPRLLRPDSPTARRTPRSGCRRGGARRLDGARWAARVGAKQDLPPGEEVL